jgi:para-nitrobenzyl esterase
MRAALAALAVFALTAAPALGSSGRPVVATDAGSVRGVDTGAMQEFLGIPYAAPPVGALRWQPPAPAAAWSGVRDASAFAPHCAQPASPYGVASTSEDCLYLNVFTPGKTNEGLPHLLPVMVWIHGGGLVVGESDDYDPGPLVSRGVVVVTLNYRLGELGFLAHPSAGNGDYGLMDQQAALHWVQANIRRFGGDPRT